MHFLAYLMVICFSSCLAHYRGSYDTRNFIIREEPLNQDDGEIIECPVCEESERWMPSNERCTIVKGNKTYKRCLFGTYVNEVCGNRLDCYRGPGEQCTEKREFDTYGKKCAPTYYCNKSLGVCTGHNFLVDSNVQFQLNRFPVTWRRNDLKADFETRN